MKIGFIVRTLNVEKGGGSHYNAIQYIRALRAHGHSVDVHVFYQQGNSVPADIPVTIHEGFGRGLQGERDYLKEILESLEASSDVFFLYGVDFIWGGGAYRKQGRVPCVVYLDAYLSSMRKNHTASIQAWLYQFKRLAWDKTVGLASGRYIDRFLPCSPYIGAVYQDFGFPRDRFVVLPNIVPLATTGVERTRRTAGTLRLLYAGRLVEDKGIDILLNALAALKDKDVHLTIVGDGPLRAVVEARIKEESLPATLVGWVPQAEVASYYADADIFIHPARYPDPAPRTIVDACAFGLPVIVPSTGGSAWIAGPAGVVVQSGNQEAFTRSLATLIEDAAAREALAAEAPAQALRFTEPVVFPQLERALTFSV